MTDGDHLQAFAEFGAGGLKRFQIEGAFGRRQDPVVHAVRALRSSHGTRLELCSLSVVRMTSPLFHDRPCAT